MIKAIISLFWLVFLTLNAYAASPRLESFSIVNISPAVENVIFTFSKIKKYRFIMLSNDYWYIAASKEKIKIDCPLKPKLSVKRILVRNIRNETRIFLRMDSRYKYRYRLLLSRDGRYLIVRIEKNISNLISTKPKTLKKHAHIPIIVIDPGHGGKDPGAIGIYNEEKNVVLSIAKLVAYYLKREHYRVFLTRTGDTYPTLAQRAEFANKVKADIFVSIHANYALKNRLQARGLEVYFLNTTSDARAIRLAARENGIPVSKVGDINKIILSLIQSSKIDKSKVLATYVYKNTLKYGKRVYKGYKGRGVKQAPFFVLVDTRCPSILIETAFINNPKDALMLKSPVFKRQIAYGIAKGIEAYINSPRFEKQ